MPKLSLSLLHCKQQGSAKIILLYIIVASLTILWNIYLLKEDFRTIIGFALIAKKSLRI